MGSRDEADTNRRGQPRVAFDGVVRLRYRLFQEFLQENAANISSGGMFIRTDHPGAPGEELDLEIRLGQDATLINGRAEVVWVRRQTEEPGAPSGMGIRFVELAGDSRALVDKIVRERVAAGLELFDLEGQAPAAAPGERPTEAAPADSVSGPIWQLDSTGEADEILRAHEPSATRRPAPPSPSAATPGPPGTERRLSGPFRLVAVAVVAALVGAGAVLTFYWLYVSPSIEALETRIDELAGSPGGPWRPPAEEPEPVAATAEADGGAPPQTSLPGGRLGVVDVLRAWAAAWSEQRSDDYLGFYAADFQPPDGLDRAAWEAARRVRIERPEWIRVALTLVVVEPTGADTAEVRFVQSYRSGRYKDLVRKRMLMVQEDGNWKIAAEQVLP